MGLVVEASPKSGKCDANFSSLSGSAITLLTASEEEVIALVKSMFPLLPRLPDGDNAERHDCKSERRTFSTIRTPDLGLERGPAGTFGTAVFSGVDGVAAVDADAVTDERLGVPVLAEREDPSRLFEKI